MVDVVPSDDIGSPCSHGRADSEGETLVKCLSEQGQHLVALGAVREVGHPCGTRVPNSWVGVFSLTGRGGREQLAFSRAWTPAMGPSVCPAFRPHIASRLTDSLPGFGAWVARGCLWTQSLLLILQVLRDKWAFRRDGNYFPDKTAQLEQLRKSVSFFCPSSS